MSHDLTAFNKDIILLTHLFDSSQPRDHLQFCANYFLNRLETERADLRALSESLAENLS